MFDVYCLLVGSGEKSSGVRLFSLVPALPEIPKTNIRHPIGKVIGGGNDETRMSNDEGIVEPRMPNWCLVLGASLELGIWSFLNRLRRSCSRAGKSQGRVIHNGFRLS
jgi:hypothetical protein